MGGTVGGRRGERLGGDVAVAFSFLLERARAGGLLQVHAWLVASEGGDFVGEDAELSDEVAWAEVAVEIFVADGIVVGALDEDCF